ncbi:ABC transporter permease [candidate division KSB1 bacterium]|nr:ABC transporter permease [candidate division KSB1 bacterium]NIR70025.1 ABC transporter permease [candidate division KSB1 bacterium]NIS23923.1 ABC transporter permease [candidate division KSB1 bacterium]NIT70840.1 ABC transporter permease [candidate division KSB1 bacterium]NIU24571.1 ABC transporter permease [candidate division KSB1 bacterium]
MKTKFLKLAIKNIARNKRRSAITAMIIVFGNVALILAGGFIKFTFWGLSESSIRREYGHLQIFLPEALEKEEETPLQYGLSDADSLIQILQTLEEVRFAMPRIGFMGLISNGDKSVVFMGRAVIPEKEQKLSGFSVQMDEGHHLGEDVFAQDEDEVILAAGLAKSLGAEIGEYLTLMTTTTSGALNAIDVKVVGIFSTGIPEMDVRLLNVKLGTAQLLLNTNRVSNIVVVLKETKYTDLVAEKAAQLLDGFAIKKWYDLAAFYQAVVSLYTNIFTFLGALIFVVVLLASSNTMMMSIFERTQEIGTLMAVGTSGKRLLSNFLLEGLALGVLAAAAGLLLGLLLSVVINHAGITMPPPPGSTRGYPLNVKYVTEIYVGTFILMVITAVVSTLFPAFKASRMKIVDALGHI